MKILKYVFLLGMIFSQFDWVDDGLAIRQGVHIEWQRTADIDEIGNLILDGLIHVKVVGMCMFKKPINLEINYGEKME